jgi:hypothetical protein
VRFVFIALVLSVDEVLNELLMSYTTTRDLVRYRLRWIVQEKLRKLWRTIKSPRSG